MADNFSELVYQQSVAGEYEYPETDEVREELVSRLYIPVRRVPRQAAGYRGAHMPEGTTHIVLWQTLAVSAVSVRSFWTAEADEETNLIDYRQALRAAQEAIGSLWVGIPPWHDAEARAEQETLEALVKRFLSKRASFAELREAVA